LQRKPFFEHLLRGGNLVPSVVGDLSYRATTKANFASVCSVKCQLLVILVPSDSRTNGSFLRHG
jgi:hypothetical protein